MGTTLYAGIDIGAQSAKAAVFDGERMLGARVAVTDDETDVAARGVYTELLDELGLTATWPPSSPPGGAPAT